MAGLLDDEDLTPDGPPSELPPLPEDVAEEEAETRRSAIVIEERDDDEPTSPAQTAREQLQGAMGALLARLQQDAEANDTSADDEAATLRRLEARARIAKQLADSHRDILALQSIPDPDRADKDRKGSLGRLAAALRHAHGAPVTTRPPGEE
jgi:hypothetical protein